MKRKYLASVKEKYNEIEKRKSLKEITRQISINK